MRRLALIAVTLLAFGLAGCGGISEGTVLQKTYEPAEAWSEYDYCATSYYVSEYNSFTKTTDMRRQCVGGYVNRYDDADWKIHIEKCDEQDTSKCEQNWLDVKREVYQTLTIGAFFDGKGRVRDWDSDHRGWGLH